MPRLSLAGPVRAARLSGGMGVAGVSIGAISAVTLTGPTSGTVSVASAPFTIGANGPVGTSIVVTMWDGGGGGTFKTVGGTTITTVTLTTGAPSATFTYTPATTGAKTISITSNPVLSYPASITYTSNAAGGGATLISADRLYDWARAGVTGGIPAQTQTIYTTINSTGDATDRSSTINSAITACPAGQVVKLGAGTFRCNSTITLQNETGVVLRGSGMDTTILDVRANPGINIGNGNADWPWNNTGTSLSLSASKGDTTLTFSSTSALNVGDRLRIYLNNDPQIPVLNVDGAGSDRLFQTKITQKTATTITLKDPLPYALPLSLSPGVHVIADGFAYQCGVEDLTVNCANASITFGVRLWSVDECWLKNVKSSRAANYDFYFLNSTHCEMRRCYADTTLNPGNNGSGCLVERTSCSLFEDNILYRSFPHFEINFGCSGNVFAYNTLVDNTVSGVTQGASMDTNHGAHNSFNLYEGNVSPQFCADGYFGSVSHDVAFRNRFHGTNDGATYKGSNGSHCVELNRFTRSYSLVENVLGVTQSYWTALGGGTLVYDALENSSEPSIYFLGYPNLGSSGFTGTAQLSASDPWSSWSSWPSGAPSGGASGFQELDRDVALTLTRKRNYCSTSSGIPAAEDQTSTEPESLFRTSKPSWFNSLTWPAYGTGGHTGFGVASSDLSKIPSGYRYYNAGADPA